METKKEVAMRIGANIKREREKAGLTQEQFSELIGIGPKSLSAVERGVVGTSIALLKRICNTLAVSADMIIFGDTGTRNNVEEMTRLLEMLSPEQCELASDILRKVILAFSLEKK